MTFNGWQDREERWLDERGSFTNREINALLTRAERAEEEVKRLKALYESGITISIPQEPIGGHHQWEIDL